MNSKTCNHCKHGLCISKVYIFKGFDHTTLIEILKKIRHLSYKKGDIIVQEGDLTSSLFIINTGIAKLVRTSVFGKEQIIDIQSDGDIIGEYYVLTENVPYRFSVVALTDIKLCSLQKKDMDALLDVHPYLSRSMLTQLSKKMIDIEDKLQNLTLTDTDSKVAFLLLELYGKFGTKDDTGYIIQNPLSREDMANFSGLTRETMSRYLNKLAKENIIEFVGLRNIRLLQKDYLSELLR